MNLSDPSDDDSSSDASPVAAKRPRTDTLGASSTTSHGSVLQESDEDDDNRVNTFNAQSNKVNTELNYKQIVSEDNLRLSRSSMSENCSSPNDQYEDYNKPGFNDVDAESEEETPRAHFQDSTHGNASSFSDTEQPISFKGDYSSKAQKMMSNMGFKHGKGLGKFEHGRTEPVEASNQKGRRGLGLQPSVVGETPRDFKWSPDDAKPEAHETVSWMEMASNESLLGDTLEEWMTRGPKKKTIDDQTDFVDPQILKGVLHAKTMFDTLDDEDLRTARFKSNPYEKIGSAMFLNRAAVKMANIDAVFDFMFTNPKKPNGESLVDKKELLYFADVCAGPGGFSEYILYRRRWRAKGFGFTLKAMNDFKLTDFYAGPPETFNPYYGVEDDGNIFNPANLTALKDKVLAQTDDKGVHFLMADGGFSVEGQENLQEILSKQLYLCQCLAALMLVRTGGHFVVKLFDCFTHFSVGLIYLMYRCFDKVSIHKPVTSRPANSERYLICKWKRVGTESVEQHMFSVSCILWREVDENNDITTLVPLSVIREDKNFFQYIYNSNCVIGERQIKNLLKISEFSKNKSLKEESQVEMQQQCLKLWAIPDTSRKQPVKLSPDETLNSILSEMKCRPSDTHSLPTFKANILGKLPTYLENQDVFKLFKSVYDWYFVFLDSDRKSADLQFFIGCGGKQVYQLDGTRWKSVFDLHLTLPAKTLLYGEIVKELRGEGSTQMHTKALHVIDAFMLGGVDISYLPLSERINQCNMFCSAVEKPFEANALAIRCKRLFNMEHFPDAVQNLEYRAMKRVRQAVTISIPNRISRKDIFHVVRSVLFIKEIKEPWETHMSKSSDRKYYFGLGADNKPRSEYHIPKAACMDPIGAFTNRIMWPWEPPNAAFEGHKHEGGVTRTELERHIAQKIKT